MAKVLEPVRVVILEDHEMVADALALSIGSTPDLEVVAVVHDLDGAVAAVGRHRPEVLLADLRIGTSEVTTATDELRDASPDTALLVVTGWATERVLDDCLDRGAAGLLCKQQPLDEILAGIRRVAGGEVVVAPALLPALLRRSRGDRGPDRAAPSAREREVLVLLADGRSTEGIAEALGISVNTVRNHVRSLLQKLGVHSRLEAVSEARRRDLLPPSPRTGG